MTAQPLDLSGRWHGLYSYPDGISCPFEASLIDGEGKIAGTVEECDLHSGAPLSARIDGLRAGSSVTFVKFYDAVDEEYDLVHYEGVLADNACEIAGRWTILDNWSGSFIMVRPNGP